MTFSRPWRFIFRIRTATSLCLILRVSQPAADALHVAGEASQDLRRQVEGRSRDGRTAASSAARRDSASSRATVSARMGFLGERAKLQAHGSMPG